MIKAVLLDCYGTIVEESDDLIAAVAAEMIAKGSRSTRAELEGMWWEKFHARCTAAHGTNFQTQKEIYPKVFAEMAKETGAEGVDAERLKEKVIAFSVSSPMFADARRFFAHCSLPVYILSNIDRAEVCKLAAAHALPVAGIFTSEDAREYKPRRGIFEKGLRFFGLNASEAVYAGDSLVNDYYGARAAGIFSFGIDRTAAEPPQGVCALSALDLLPEAIVRLGV